MLFHHRSNKNFTRSTTIQEYSFPPFWPPFKVNIRNSKKIKKIKTLCIASCYVTWLQGKITNFEYYNFSKKVFPKQSYHVWRFLTFKSNYQCYGHNYDIVCSNDPILCKSVRLGMTNNVAEGSFHFFYTKNSFFNFWATQINFLVKELPKFNLKIGPKQSQKILEHLGFKIQHLVEQ
jgi:hypothetical protein